MAWYHTPETSTQGAKTSLVHTEFYTSQGRPSWGKAYDLVLRGIFSDRESSQDCGPQWLLLNELLQCTTVVKYYSVFIHYKLISSSQRSHKTDANAASLHI